MKTPAVILALVTFASCGRTPTAPRPCTMQTAFHVDTVHLYITDAKWRFVGVDTVVRMFCR